MLTRSKHFPQRRSDGIHELLSYRVECLNHDGASSIDTLVHICRLLSLYLSNTGKSKAEENQLRHSN